MPVLFNIRRKYARRGASERVNIAEATITLSANSFVYTGEAITPAVTVTYKGETLELDRDYFLSYGDNMAIGRGYATVTGDGMYKGTARAYFYITAAEPEPVPGAWNFDLEKSSYSGMSSMFMQGTVNPLLHKMCVGGGVISCTMSTNGHPTAFGFDGEYFDAKNMVRQYSGPNLGESYINSMAFSEDGQQMFVFSANGFFLKYSLSTPFDVSSIGPKTKINIPGGYGSSASYPVLSVFDEGRKYACKSIGLSNIIYISNITGDPYEFDKYEISDTLDLGPLLIPVMEKTGETSGAYIYQGLDFSKDGKSFVSVARNSSTSKYFVVRFDLENPYVVSSGVSVNSAIEIHSDIEGKHLGSISSLAIDEDADKMILFGYLDSEPRFFSYNLSA